MQIVLEDNMLDMSKPIFWENNSKCLLPKYLPSIVRMKENRPNLYNNMEQ